MEEQTGPTLKIDHLYLYKRFRLKAWLHIALGLCLLLFPLDPTPGRSDGAVSTVQQHIGNLLTVFGWIYLAIGIMLTIGVYVSRHNYRFGRFTMFIATLYNSIWLVILFVILAQRPSRSIAYITVLYAYMVYNHWIVWRDPGWKAIQFVKKITAEERSNGERASSVVK